MVRLIIMLFPILFSVVSIYGLANFIETAFLESPLFKLLSLVPRNIAVSPTNNPAGEVRFVDYSIIYDLANVSGSRNIWGAGDFEKLPVPVSLLVHPLALPQRWFHYLFLAAGKMSDVVGFEWFIDVDRVLEWGIPPEEFFILEGTFDMERIKKALETHGFDTIEVNETLILSRCCNKGFNTAWESVYPFWRFGADSFVIPFPELKVIANTGTLDSATEFVHTYRNRQPTLMDDPDYRLLAEIVAEKRDLIAAVFLSPTVLRYPGSHMEGILQQYAKFDPAELPVFSLAVLAERQDGSERVIVIALAYPDAEVAENACRIVVRRFENWDACKLIGEGTPLIKQYEKYNGKITWRVEKSPYNAAGIVEIRYVVPSLEMYKTPIPWERPPLPYQFFKVCYDAIIRGCFIPLWW